MKRLISFLGSKTLTVWLTGFFVIYYLTIAVWSKEAFASFIINLSRNNLFRSVFALFFLNIAIRVSKALIRIWPSKALFFLRLPLNLGIPILLFTFFIGPSFRDTRQIPVTKGDMVEIRWEGAYLSVTGIEPALKKKALRRDDSSIFDFEPGITLRDDRGTYSIGAFPPKRVGSTYMHILNFGIAPGVELRKGNEVVAAGNVALRLTPFGVVDSFTLEPLPYRFYLSIIPNRVIKKGREAEREYDLDRPLYDVKVTKGDKVIYKGSTDAAILFDGDTSLSLSAPVDWVLLEVVHDPFLIPFIVGLILTSFGILLYPFSLICSENPLL